MTPPPDASFREIFDALVDNVELVLRGKRRSIHLAFVCLFAEGHLLIEDVPGVGKTSLAKAMARSIGGDWHRIQFTADLLPSDVTGVSVWNRSSNDFEFRPGGVFANIVLADEINRASPKTQSALLEAMEERQVTVDVSTYRLAAPFMVIATQNPIELEGTYPLPEAQLDRFLMRLELGYPDKEAEVAILNGDDASASVGESLRPIVDAATVVRCAKEIQRVAVAPEVQRYIVDLVDATRRHRDLLLGASPRGTIALQRAARTFAASLGRSHVSPDDVKRLAPAVLEHRVVLSSEALSNGTETSAVIASVLANVPVPVTREARTGV